MASPSSTNQSALATSPQTSPVWMFSSRVPQDDDARLFLDHLFAIQPGGNELEAQATAARVTRDWFGVDDPDGSVLFGAAQPPSQHVEKLRTLFTEHPENALTEEQRAWQDMNEDQRIAFLKAGRSALQSLGDAVAEPLLAPPKDRAPVDDPGGGLDDYNASTHTFTDRAQADAQRAQIAAQKAERNRAYWLQKAGEHEDELFRGVNWVHIEAMRKALEPQEQEIAKRAAFDNQLDEQAFEALPAERQEIVKAMTQRLRANWSGGQWGYFARRLWNGIEGAALPAMDFYERSAGKVAALEENFPAAPTVLRLLPGGLFSDIGGNLYRRSHPEVFAREGDKPLDIPTMLGRIDAEGQTTQRMREMLRAQLPEASTALGRDVSIILEAAPIIASFASPYTAAGIGAPTLLEGSRQSYIAAGADPAVAELASIPTAAINYYAMKLRIAGITDPVREMAIRTAGVRAIAEASKKGILPALSVAGRGAANLAQDAASQSTQQTLSLVAMAMAQEAGNELTTKGFDLEQFSQSIRQAFVEEFNTGLALGGASALGRGIAFNAIGAPSDQAVADVLRRSVQANRSMMQTLEPRDGEPLPLRARRAYRLLRELEEGWREQPEANRAAWLGEQRAPDPVALHKLFREREHAFQQSPRYRAYEKTMAPLSFTPESVKREFPFAEATQVDAETIEMGFDAAGRRNVIRLVRTADPFANMDQTHIGSSIDAEAGQAPGWYNSLDADGQARARALFTPVAAFSVSDASGATIQNVAGFIFLAAERPGTPDAPGQPGARVSDLHHEWLHAATSIMRSAGALSDADVAELRRRYGEPATATELFNEEAAARDYAAWRFNQEADNKPFAKIRDFWRKLFGLARGRDSRTIDDFFADITAGRFGEPRAPGLAPEPPPVPPPDRAEVRAADSPADMAGDAAADTPAPPPSEDLSSDILQRIGTSRGPDFVAPAVEAVPHVEPIPLEPDQQAVHSEFMALATGRPQDADAAYNALPESRGGVIIGTDLYRFVTGRYGTREAQLRHTKNTKPGASILAHERLDRVLANPPQVEGRRPRLLIMAGGAGSGKSTVLNLLDAGAFGVVDVVSDQQMREGPQAAALINRALGHGWDVVVRHVFRPFDEVVPAVIARSNAGRWNNLHDLPDIHMNSQAALEYVATQFAGNDRVDVGVLENRTGKDLRAIPLQHLLAGGDRRYTQSHRGGLYDIVNREISSAYASGNYDTRVLDLIAGRTDQISFEAARGEGADDSGRSAPEPIPADRAAAPGDGAAAVPQGSVPPARPGDSARHESQELPAQKGVEPPPAPLPENATLLDLVNAQSPVVEAPLGSIAINKRIPQFKRDADPVTGVVHGQELAGRYQRLPMPAPILLFEGLDGVREVVTGRHRLDLARRSGERTIPAQILRESDGWTPERAMLLDAFDNIRDEKGSVRDYARFFRDAKIQEAQAQTEGLLGRQKGKDGWALAQDSSPDLWAAAMDSGELGIDPAQAAAIARAASVRADPRNEGLQAVGIKLALKGTRPALLGEALAALRRRISADAAAGNQVQGDMFGFDDTALRESMKEAQGVAMLKADNRKEREDLRAALTKRDRVQLTPERQKALGITDQGNQVELERALQIVNERSAALENWMTNSELIQEARARVGLDKKAPRFSVASQGEEAYAAAYRKLLDAEDVATPTDARLNPEAFGLSPDQARRVEIMVEGEGPDVEAEPDIIERDESAGGAMGGETPSGQELLARGYAELLAWDAGQRTGPYNARRDILENMKENLAQYGGQGITAWGDISNKKILAVAKDAWEARRARIARRMDTAERGGGLQSARRWLASRPRFSVTPAQDAGYMRAVEGDHLGEAAAYVTIAARAAGYRIGPLYHQTGKEIAGRIMVEGFDNSAPGARGNDHQVPDGYFFKPDNKDIGVAAMGKDVAQVPVFLRLDNALYVADRYELGRVLDQDPDYAALKREYDKVDQAHIAKHDAFDKEWRDLVAQGGPRDEAFGANLKRQEEHLKEWEADDKQHAAVMRKRVTEFLLANGHDGLVIESDAGSFGRRTKTFVTLDPRQAKSAEPVTRTDSGKVIPLYKRFDSEMFAIRFSVRDRRVSPADYPDSLDRVLTSTNVGALEKAPSFESAKRHGDNMAAAMLVMGAMRDDVLAALQARLDPAQPIVWVPVLGREGESVNRIPLAYAEALAHRYGGKVSKGVVKANRVHNTGKAANDRAQTAHAFDGTIEEPGQVVIVDDTFTSGSTITALVDHLAQLGRMPVAATALASGRYGVDLKPRAEKRQALLDKAGYREDTLNHEHGFNSGKLTGAEIQQYILNGARGRDGFVLRFGEGRSQAGEPGAGRDNSGADGAAQAAVRPAPQVAESPLAAERRALAKIPAEQLTAAQKARLADLEIAAGQQVLFDVPRAEDPFKLDARRRQENTRAEIIRRAQAKLSGNTGNLGQADLFGQSGDLFAGDKPAPAPAAAAAQGDLFRFSVKQIEGEPFKEWFGDWQAEPEQASKILDPEGRPLVVYHGSVAQFDTFRIRGSEISYFAEDPNYAAGFAWFKQRRAAPGEDAAGSVYPAYVNVRRPLDMREFELRGLTAPELSAALKERGVRIRTLKPSTTSLWGAGSLPVWLWLRQYPQVRSAIVNSGFDGIRFRESALLADSLDPAVELKHAWSYAVAVFKPNQIKSAIANVGTFDPTTGNIRYSVHDFGMFAGPRLTPEDIRAQDRRTGQGKRNDKQNNQGEANDALALAAHEIAPNEQRAFTYPTIAEADHLDSERAGYAPLSYRRRAASGRVVDPVVSTFVGLPFADQPALSQKDVNAIERAAQIILEHNYKVEQADEAAGDVTGYVYPEIDIPGVQDGRFVPAWDPLHNVKFIDALFGVDPALAKRLLAQAFEKPVAQTPRSTQMAAEALDVPEDLDGRLEVDGSDGAKQPDLFTQHGGRFSVRYQDPRETLTVATAGALYRGKMPAPEQIEKGIKNLGLTGRVTPEQIQADARRLAQGLYDKVQKDAADPEILAALRQAALRGRYRTVIEGAMESGVQDGYGFGRAASRVQAAEDRAAAQEILARQGFGAGELQAAYHLDFGKLFENMPDTPAPAPSARPAAEAGQAAGDRAEVPAPATVPVPDNIRQAVTDMLTAVEQRRQAAEAERAQDRSRLPFPEPPPEEAAGSEATSSPREILERLAPEIRTPLEFRLLLTELVRAQLSKAGDGRRVDFTDAGDVRDLARTAEGIFEDIAQDLLPSRSRESIRLANRQLLERSTHEGVGNAIEKIAGMVSRERLRQSREELISEAESLLRMDGHAGGRFRRALEELKRPIQAKVELWAREVLGVLRMSDADVESRNKELDGLIAREQSPDATGDEIALDTWIRRKQALVEYGGLRNRMPGEISDALDRIEQELSGSRARLEQAAEDREIRTKADMENLLAAVRNPNLRHTPETRSSDFLDTHFFDNRLRMFIRFAPAHIRRAAEEVIDRLRVSLAMAGEARDAEIRRHEEDLGRAIQRIYGQAPGVVIQELLAPAPALGRFSRQDVAMTRARALMLLAQASQRDYADNLVKHGRDGTYARDLATALSPQDLALLEYFRDWYRNNRPGLSEVQARIAGLDVLTPGKYYMPAVIKRDPQGIAGEHRAWSPLLPSLTPRVKHGLDFDEHADVLTTWRQRMREAAQFKHMAEIGIELRGILGRRDLGAELVRSHGKQETRRFRDHLTDILLGPEAFGSNPLFDRARSLYALMRMSWNPGGGVRQLAGMPAFGLVVGLRNTLKYMASPLSAEGVEAMRALAASEAFRNRWGSGASEEIANALANPRTMYERFLAKGMVFYKLGDAVGSLWVGQGIYRDAIAARIANLVPEAQAKAEAIALTFDLINTTQGSHRPEHMVVAQRRGGSLGKAAYSLQGPIGSALSLEVAAWRAAVARQDRSARGLARAIIINHILVPAAFWGMYMAWNAALGQQQKEEDVQRLFVAMISGPLSGLILLGAGGERTIEHALGMKGYGAPDMIPAAGLWDTSNDLVDILSAAGDMNLEETIDAAQDLAKHSSPAIRDAAKAYKNWGE